MSTPALRPFRVLATAIPLTVATLLACAQPRDAATGDSASPSADAGAPPRPSGTPMLTTDRDRYTVRRTADAMELDIVSTFTNRTADTVYLHPCGTVQPSFLLEKWVNGAWQPAYNPPCPAMLMVNPPSVAPGASHTDTARVRALTAANSFPRFEVDPAGGYFRLVYAQAYGSWRPSQGSGELLPREQRSSPPFRIED
jgi:hypothetical protein